MRLLNVLSLTVSVFEDSEVPPYAILSHRWSSDEVTYTDVIERRNVKSEGYRKLSAASNCVRLANSDIRWLWVDTCCIDQSSSAELSEAINSMFRWYQEAEVCFAYLADVTSADDLDMFKRTSWFTRGWTLQELLAPPVVIFFTRDWKPIGHKGMASPGARYGSLTPTVALDPVIEIATGIPRKILQKYQYSDDVSTAEKWRWTEKRKTTRAEDRAYCLLGLFNVNMSPAYGEGLERAMARLSTEIMRQGDTDALTWDTLWTGSTLPRNRSFVDRPYLMKQIERKLKAPAARVALTGIGGTGKTQLAIEYCHRLMETSPETSVFWMRGSNAACLHQNVTCLHRTVREYLTLGRADRCRQHNPIHTWRDTVSDDGKGQWLVVVDGLDDMGLLDDAWRFFDDGPDDHGIMQTWSNLLSVHGRGSVLITSRSKQTALQLVDCSDMLEIGPMEMEESSLLIKKLLEGQSVDVEDRTMRELALVLNNIPLAISQVTAYIRTRRNDLSTAKCMSNLLDDKSARLMVLEGRDPDVRRNRQAKNSVVSTWRTSFEYMSRLRPSVIDVLSVMSQCDHRRFSRSFLLNLNQRYQPAHKTEVPFARSSEADQTPELDEDIWLLLQNSFLTKRPECEFLGILELVQISIRAWLIAEGRFEQLEAEYIGKLDDMLSREHSDQSGVWEDLLPHVKMVETSLPRSPGASSRWASVMHTAAWSSLSTGNTYDSQRMAELAVQVRSTDLGFGHISTLSSMSLVALAKQRAGLLEEAEAMGRRVVAQSKTLLGEHHPLTLTNMASLSWTLQEQGRWTEAEAMEQTVLNGNRQVLGPDHPSTLASMHNMASILQNIGRTDKAQELMHQVLTWEKRKLGEEHPATLTTTDNLALLLQSSGRLDQAEKMSRRACEGFKSVLGPDHVDTCISVHNLASILRDRGELQESYRLLRHTAAKREEMLGKYHEHTLASLSSLASVLCDMQRYDEAEELNRMILEARERVMGPEHPQTLTSMSNLGLVLRCRGKYKEAERLTRRALEGYRQILGNDHQHTLTVTNNLADLLLVQGYGSYHKKGEDRGPQDCSKTQTTERPTGKHKRSSIGSMNLAIRGYEKTKRSKTRLAQV